MRSVIRTPEFLVLIVGLWLLLLCNSAFWSVVTGGAWPVDGPSALHLLKFGAIAVPLVCALLLMLSPGPAVRPALILALLACVPVGYFTSHLGVLFDDEMLRNVLETNRSEATELVTPRFIAYVGFFGALPALLVAFYPLRRRRLRRALAERVIAIVLALGLTAGVFAANQKDVVPFVRNHREIRYLLGPVNVLSAGYSVAFDAVTIEPPFRHIAPDAARILGANHAGRPTVHVMVVGETARAGSFSLGGYPRQTNPEMQARAVDYFADVTACGTATSMSLPCLFSAQGHAEFERDVSAYQDNLLDIAAQVGYQVFWRDNGNSCKGVCSRVDSASLGGEDSPQADLCNAEGCYDEVLVAELERLLTNIRHDSLIVMHQIGSHGPAYYLRYPEQFRRFVPDCRSAELSDCSPEEIVNAYDNTILYTDHVIARMIDVLQAHADQVDSTLLYVSDHGESLGEKGLYLHGMLYRLAPAEQLKVPMVSWTSAAMSRPAGSAPACTERDLARPISHDVVFHSMLGRLGIVTAAYSPDLDVLRPCGPVVARFVDERAVQSPLHNAEPVGVTVPGG